MSQSIAAQASCEAAAASGHKVSRERRLRGTSRPRSEPSLSLSPYISHGAHIPKQRGKGDPRKESPLHLSLSSWKGASVTDCRGDGDGGGGGGGGGQ